MGLEYLPTFRLKSMVCFFWQIFHTLSIWELVNLDHLPKKNTQGIVGRTPTNVPLWEIPI